MTMTLEKDRVGLLTYALFDESGAVLDGTTQGRLFAYLHGHANLPATLETVLEGRSEGDEFDETITEAFGPKQNLDPQPVRKRDLPKPVRDNLQVGIPFSAEASDGTVHQLWIKSIKGASVFVTTEHPLAGQTVRFAGRVTRVREATPSELEDGRAYGADGRQRSR